MIQTTIVVGETLSWKGLAIKLVSVGMGKCKCLVVCPEHASVLKYSSDSKAWVPLPRNNESLEFETMDIYFLGSLWTIQCRRIFDRFAEFTFGKVANTKI